MLPLSDWMELKRFERRDAGLVLPDGAREDDPDNVYEVLSKGPGCEIEDIKVGTVVMFYGIGVVGRTNLPCGRNVYVGKESDVCFILEGGDLHGGA